jgi:hypothetical protein
MGAVVWILLRGDSVVASVPGQGDQEIVPYRGSEFTLKNTPGTGIEFIVDAAGAVTGAVVAQGGMRLMAKRK